MTRNQDPALPCGENTSVRESTKHSGLPGPVVANLTCPFLVSVHRCKCVDDRLEIMFLDPFPFFHAKVILRTDSPRSLKHAIGDDPLSYRLELVPLGLTMFGENRRSCRLESR